MKPTPYPKGDKERLIVLEQQIIALDEARKLQAAEYERRLTDLNHSHNRALEVQATYVTEEKFQVKIEAIEEIRRNDIRTIYTAIAVGIAFLTTIIVLAIFLTPH